MRSLLEKFPVPIPEIGEMDTRVWKHKTDTILQKVIERPTDLLIDMLAATSYKNQLNRRIPLSDIQKTNIKKGFDNDLGIIILNENQKLEKNMADTVTIKDLSEERFDLFKYLDSRFQGKALVVDLWNTWCGPCKISHRQLMEMDLRRRFPNVVFVYICDTSSPANQWKQDSGILQGHSIRISKKDMNSILEEYSLEGFPSHLFYDNQHRLNYKETGAKSLNDFISQINKLNVRDTNEELSF